MPAATIFTLLLALAAGCLLAIQAPTNAILAKAGGSPILATLISFGVGFVALAVALVATLQRVEVGALRSVPAYAWFGGIYGAIFVAIAAFAAPRIGLASLITCGIAGQILMALALDHFGALGLARAPLSVVKVGGALLVLAGVVLVRRG